MNGIVYLVGAGPGAVGLLTLRAAALLKRAEVLVYDYLASPELLNMIPEKCRRIYVGKMSGNHAKSQDEINRILVDEAKAGHVVVRLKGGDPYIFGRGGEEAQELYKAGVVFEVVPGISSTIAAAAALSWPLPPSMTMRSSTPCTMLGTVARVGCARRACVKTAG